MRNYVNAQGGRMVPSDVREVKYEKYEMVREGATGQW
jgi:hypothetical protein